MLPIIQNNEIFQELKGDTIYMNWNNINLDSFKIYYEKYFRLVKE